MNAKIFREIEPGETLQAGDELLAQEDNYFRWEPVHPQSYGRHVSPCYHAEYRRPIVLPAQQYLLMARYVSKDVPLRIYDSLSEAYAVATNLDGEDHYGLRDAFPETVSPLDAPDFCGFEILLIMADGTVGQAVETFGREPDAI